MTDRFCRTAFILSLLSILFIVGGVLLFVLGESTIRNSVKKECQLRPGSITYKNWHDPPVPVYVSIYVFDLNNTDFLNGTSKPCFRQRGPFVYKEERKKIAVKQYENQTISYQEPRTYTFISDRSAEDENVNITTINVVYMALINFLQMEHAPSIFRRMVVELLAVQEKPIMQRTVKEYLWGYQDPLLHILKREFPEIVPDDQVSVFNTSVVSAGSNTYLINNGVGTDADHNERIHEVGKIEKFNFKSTLSYWSNEYANMINGTDSTIWHPDASKTERVYAFISDICRSVYLEYNNTYTNKYNIENYQYLLPNSVFDNSTDNDGFCLNSTTSNKTYHDQCLPSGLFSLKTCVHLSGSKVSIPLPIIASSPHFLAADTSVQNAVIGLAPDETKHRSFVDIEPITGIVMNGSRRLQININVLNDSTISAIQNLNPVVFPMIWIDEHAEIDETNANTFRKKVTIPITAINVGKYVILVVGVICFILAIGLLAYRRYKKSKSGPAFEVRTADETSPLLF